MGGHNGGEIASEIASETVGRTFVHHSIEGLIEAVESANPAVYGAGVDDPELTGMGTTVVALAVVDHEEAEVLAIANVGDSRCYRYADGELDQVTTDHSLVAEMVREGSLSPEEAAVHPQRNIVTRVLGVHDEVPVDVFAVDPYPGDRYVLCSDGLFNEVPERGIAGVLRTIDDPDEAAEELVHLAVDGGGPRQHHRRRGRRASTTGAAPPTRPRRWPARRSAASRAPGPSPAPPTPATSRRGGASGATSDTAELDSRRRSTTTTGRRRRQAPARAASARHAAARPRRAGSRGGCCCSSLLVVALVGGVVATIQWYGTSAYFVGFDGDQVAIYKGRPGGVLWIDPELVDVTDLDRDDVPDARRGRHRRRASSRARSPTPGATSPT